MKKKFVILISFIMMLGIVVGCSSNAKSFDDKNLLFKVVDTQKINSKIIEISNETGIDLDNLSLKISYPLYTSNENSKRETIKTLEEFKINSNETKEISISFPVQDGIENLEVDLQGNVMTEKDKSVPFEIAGALRALIETLGKGV